MVYLPKRKCGKQFSNLSSTFSGKKTNKDVALSGLGWFCISLRVGLRPTLNDVALSGLYENDIFLVLKGHNQTTQGAALCYVTNNNRSPARAKSIQREWILK